MRLNLGKLFRADPIVRLYTFAAIVIQIGLYHSFLELCVRCPKRLILFRASSFLLLDMVIDTAKLLVVVLGFGLICDVERCKITPRAFANIDLPVKVRRCRSIVP